MAAVFLQVRVVGVQARCLKGWSPSTGVLVLKYSPMSNAERGISSMWRYENEMHR